MGLTTKKDTANTPQSGYTQTIYGDGTTTTADLVGYRLKELVIPSQYMSRRIWHFLALHLKSEYCARSGKQR
jgi:hypothetical protein